MARNKTSLVARAEYALAATLVTALRRLPLSLAERLAFGVTRGLDLAVPKLRRVALTNLAFAFPELSAGGRSELADGVFRTVSRMLLMLARFPDLNAANIGEWISYEGLENYLQAKREGRGVLVATAHVGNWELSAFSHALMTEPMNVMVRPLDNPLIDAMVEGRRSLSGNKLIYKWEGARSVLRALRNNEAVGILIDQNTSASEGVFVNFFGKLACANTAFVRLAYHARAPVVPGFAVWDHARRRYTLHFYPALLLTGNEAADTQLLHTTLEGIVRSYPDQWMWIHRRWKTRPPGEKPVY